MTSFVCIASGPSLTQADCDLVRMWRGEADERKVIGVNCAYIMAPWCDFHYATDLHFWYRHHDTIASLMRDDAELWSVNAVKEYSGIHVMKDGRDCAGKKVTDHGSGLKAVRLAEHLGATRVALLGYDFGSDEDGRSHFHEPHAEPFVNHVSFGTAPRSEFVPDVTQCSRRSADVRCNWFEKKSLEEWLAV